MMDELQRIALSKKGQRQVTPFTGNELLFDYLLGVLDEERKQAVATFLESSPEAQNDFQKIQTGLQYAQKLDGISVSPQLLSRLSTPSSYFSVLFEKSRFDQWPIGLKWGLEALIVVFVIVTFLSLAPWERVLNLRLATSSNDVVLTEINKKTVAANFIDEQVPDIKESPEFIDEGVAAPALAPVLSASPLVAAATTIPKPSVAAEVTKVEEPASGKSNLAGASSTKVFAGSLFRGKLAVTNLEAVGPKIRDKILELGGRKAGEVELGWQKTPDSAYFHFTIPEAKSEELKTFLSGYGTANISEEKHPRVMPDGIVRLIITVDEAKK